MKYELLRRNDSCHPKGAGIQTKFAENKCGLETTRVRKIGHKLGLVEAILTDNPQKRRLYLIS